MIWTLLIALCILISRHGLHCFLWGPETKGTTHYNEDLTGKDDKEIIVTMAKELLIDAKLYHRHIMVIREQHSMMLAYEVGFTMGKIREKYKRMMEAYHEAYTKKNNLFNILPPYVLHYRSLHFLVHMEIIRSQEMEIDKLVHVLETIPAKMIGDRNALPNMKKIMQAEGMMDTKGDGTPGEIPDNIKGLIPPDQESGPPPAVARSPAAGAPAAGSPVAKPGGGPSPVDLKLRSEDKDLKFIGSKTQLTAEDVKKAYRDQYYSKRREDNWTLDDYYGFPG